MKKTGIKKSGASARTPVTAGLRGLLCSLVVTVLSCALFALLILKGIVPLELSASVSSVAAALAAFCGAYLAARQAKGQKLLCALAMCGAYALILLMGNLLFVTEAPTGALRIVLPVLAAGALSALLGNRGRSRRPAHRK